MYIVLRVLVGLCVYIGLRVEAAYRVRSGLCVVVKLCVYTRLRVERIVYVALSVYK